MREIISKTYHVYKADCFCTSRLYMESKWDKFPVFIHRPSTASRSSWQDESEIESLRLTAVALIKLIYRMSIHHVMIFHAQPSLPYLLLSRLAAVIFNKKDIVIVYDMHDLHEHERHDGVINFIRYSVVRHFVLGMLENICFRDKAIKKMTVSKGLALEVSRKYNCNLPHVVRSVPPWHDVDLSVPLAPDNKHELLFFGSPERMPTRLMKQFEKQGLKLHLYGKDITTQSIAQLTDLVMDPDRIKMFGCYSPSDMGFLRKYTYSILYNPNVNKLNFKYSLPNKLFQALNSGLSVLVSPNFSEMIDLFSELPGAVEVIQDDDDLSAAIERVSVKRGSSYRARVSKFIDQLREEARSAYLKATMEVIGASNDV